jgi:hypothetical protein
LRSPFFAYFLWRSKESERLPGRPRQRTSPRRENSITNNKPKTKHKKNRPTIQQDGRMKKTDISE